MSKADKSKLNKEFEFALTPSGAEQCAALLESVLAGYYCDDDLLPVMREETGRLVANLAVHCEDAHTFTVTACPGLMRLHLYIKYRGEKYFPQFAPDAKDDYSKVAAEVMGKFNPFATNYRYENGENVIGFTISRKRKLNSFHHILIAIALGVPAGLACKALDAETQAHMLEIFNTFKAAILNLIIMSSTLAVFTMVVNSISGFKSLRSVRQTGLGILKYHGLNYLIALLWTFLLSFHGMAFTSAGSGNGVISSLAEFSVLLFSDMLPQDYVSPLAECNFLHIIIVAFLLGFAMLSVGESARPMKEFFRSAETVASRIMAWFSKLIPLFLFAMIPSLMLSDSFTVLSDVFIYMLIILSSILLTALTFFGYMCAKTRLPIWDSLKKISPAMLRGFLTANSALTVPDIQACAKRFGVDDSFNGYATAVGFVFSHVGILIMELVLVFGFMPVAGIAITVPAVIRIVITAILFSLAVPPTSGGNIAILTILFEAVGIGDNYLALVAPVLLIADYVETSTRCGEIVMGTVLAAHKKGN